MVRITIQGASVLGLALAAIAVSAQTTTPPATPSAAQPPAAIAVPATDTSITAAVRTALMRDPETSALRVQVSTAEGKVTLKGTVPSATAKSKVVQLAKAVEGVKDVNDQITVGKG